MRKTFTSDFYTAIGFPLMLIDFGLKIWFTLSEEWMSLILTFPLTFVVLILAHLNEKAMKKELEEKRR